MSQQSSYFMNILVAFGVWKSLIILVAFTSPGIGYDTSSDLLLHTGTGFNTPQDVPLTIKSNFLKFVRWDAIYFTETARRGHVFEQQWAFGKGLSTVLAYITESIAGVNGDPVAYALSGIVVSHLAHWFSVLLLYKIVRLTHDGQRANESPVPFVAALLHSMSPAGIFLSVPCAESLFAFLHMLGIYLYVKAICEAREDVSGKSLTYRLSSGIALGFATVVRSNGVLSGIPFLIDAVEDALKVLNPNVDTLSKSGILLQLQITVLAGSCIAVGLFWPQYLAYRDYCTGGIELRPWCEARLPLIFTFVQSHYWNVGFLRYWTVSNIPLFILAMPCLYLLAASGLQGTLPALTPNASVTQKIYLRIALPQLVLALLALTNYHVQIITRLASAYPMWYIWMAARIVDRKSLGPLPRILIMYGLIQAGLYASFLPPA